MSRELLATLSEHARNDGDAAVTLWVATMMWGSGTSNGRGPWRTAQGLASTELRAILAHSSADVRNGDLAHAHREFKLAGSGEAFFTKWFWSVSLSEPEARRALILDLRVRRALRRVLAWQPSRGADGYVGYVELMRNTADLVNQTVAGIDAEKVEWLLFDRRGANDAEPSLSESFEDGRAKVA